MTKLVNDLLPRYKSVVLSEWHSPEKCGGHRAAWIKKSKPYGQYFAERWTKREERVQKAEKLLHSMLNSLGQMTTFLNKGTVSGTDLLDVKITTLNSVLDELDHLHHWKYETLEEARAAEPDKY
jgi:hypothetical protein